MKKIFFLIGFLMIASCQNASTDIQETAQQIGDVMASIDESGESASRSMNSNEEDRQNRALCRVANTFSSCSSNVITRTFNGCTIGGATLDGTVTFTYSDAAVNSVCSLASNGHYVTRDPNFTLTGRRGATLTVTKTGSYGQKITRGSSATTYTFSNDGIRRKFTSGSTTLFDFTTTTQSDMSVTGSLDRSSRVVSGGTLRVLNNLNDVYCDYTPSTVTWNSTCNCAVSGSWSSTCSDGKASTLTITGCGTANFSMGSDTESLTFDRCYTI